MTWAWFPIKKQDMCSFSVHNEERRRESGSGRRVGEKIPAISEVYVERCSLVL